MGDITLSKTISVAVSGKTARRNTLEVISRQRYLLLMLLPTLIVITIFVYKPVLYWVIAFYKLLKGITLKACRMDLASHAVRQRDELIAPRKVINSFPGSMLAGIRLLLPCCEAVLLRCGLRFANMKVGINDEKEMLVWTEN